MRVAQAQARRCIRLSLPYKFSCRKVLHLMYTAFKTFFSVDTNIATQLAENAPNY